jgi:uncharacterized OsmC-like protein
MKQESIVKERQQPLMEGYAKDPKPAQVTDVAFVEDTDFQDPLLSHVFINEELEVKFPVGVHRAVGGRHDYPNSGDLLCASLASCLGTTIRMISNRMGIELKKMKITAKANADVRGTLRVSSEVPVGFQSMSLEAEVQSLSPVKDEVLHKLLKAAEGSCIILQTINQGIPVDVNMKILH